MNLGALEWLAAVAVAAGAAAAVAYFLSRRLALSSAKKDEGSLLLIQQQIEQMRAQLSQDLDRRAQLINQQLGQVLANVTERLKENSEALQNAQKSLSDRLDRAAQVVGNVQKSLGSLEEANRKIYEVGKDIASLQEILRAPKLRGGLGEFFLGDLLAQILPPQNFELQYTFKSGEKVDAVIKLGSSLVPVDAKFPLENFKRVIEAQSDEEKARARRQFANDVKRHVDAIASKYILPDEGTYDFALMYVPAENVYYETIIKDEGGNDKAISAYALSKRVVPVSPNSFYAYLQAIVLGLRGMKIEERAREIFQSLARLQGDFARFREDFGVLGRHLGHAQSSFQNAERRLDQLGQKLVHAVEERERLPEQKKLL
jgi:DNA recombination protein RmuC